MFHVEHFVGVILYVLQYTYIACIRNNVNGLRGAGRLAGFRGRAEASDGTDAGVAGILLADQEGSGVASGCRGSGMVQTAGTRWRHLSPSWRSRRNFRAIHSLLSRLSFKIVSIS